MLNENTVRGLYEQFCHDTAIEDNRDIRIAFTSCAMSLGLVLQIPYDKIQENIDSYNTASGGVANDG